MPLWKVLSGAIDQDPPLLTGTGEHSGEHSRPDQSALASRKSLVKDSQLSGARQEAIMCICLLMPAWKLYLGNRWVDLAVGDAERKPCEKDSGHDIPKSGDVSRSRIV